LRPLFKADLFGHIHIPQVTRRGMAGDIGFAVRRFAPNQQRGLATELASVSLTLSPNDESV
jgi:hypothetical protein